MYCAEGLGSGINSKQNRYTAKGNIYKLEEYIYKTTERHTLQRKVFGNSAKGLGLRFEYSHQR